MGLFEKWRGCYRERRWIRVLVRTGVGLLAVLVVAWGVLEFWVGPHLIKRAHQALAKTGIHLSFGDIDLALVRGRLAAEDTTLFRSAAKEIPVLSLSHLEVNIGVWDLITGGGFGGTGEVRKGKAVVYGAERETVLDDLDLTFELDGEHVRILGAEAGTNFGQSVSLTGEIRWGGGEGDLKEGGEDERGEEGTSEGENPEFPVDLAWLHLVAEIFTFDDPGETGRLELRLDWDGTRPEKIGVDGEPGPVSQLTIDGMLTGENVVWQNVPLEAFSGSFRFEDWEVKIPELKLVGLGGGFDGQGAYLIGSNKLAVANSRLTMDPVRLLDTLGFELAGELSRFEYDISPVISGESLVIDFSDIQSSELVLSLEDRDGFRYRAGPGEGEYLEVDRFSGELRYSATGELGFHDLAVRANGLDLAGQVVLRPNPNAPGSGQDPGVGEATEGDASRPVDDTAMPEAADKEASPLVGLFNRIARFETKPDGEAPRIEFDVLWDEGKEPGSRLEATGSIRGKDFLWKGRPMVEADLEFDFRDDKFTLERGLLAGPKGNLEGAGSFDFRSEVLAVPRLVSTIDIAEMVRNAGLELEAPFDTVAFPVPPRITAEGFELRMGEALSGNGKFGLVASEGFSLSDGEDRLEVGALDMAVSWSGGDVLVAEHLSGRVGDLEFFGKGNFRWGADQGGGSGGDRGGVRVQGENGASGDVEGEPGDGGGGEGVEEPSGWVGFVGRLLEFEAGEGAARPKLAINVSWDATKPERSRLAAAANFAGGNFRWHDHPVESAVFGASFVDQVIRCDRVQLRGLGGELDGEGSFDLKAQKLRVPRFESTIDYGMLEEEMEIDLGRQIDRVMFPSPPRVLASDLVIDFGEVPTGQGRVELVAGDGLTLVEGGERLEMERFSAAVFWGDPGVLRIERVSGLLGGLAFLTAGEIRWSESGDAGAAGSERERSSGGEMEEGEVAVVAKPLLIPVLQEYLTVVARGDPVSIQGGFVWDESRRGEDSEWFDLLRFNAEIKGSDFRWRRNTVVETDGRISLDQGVMAFRPFLFRTTEGRIETEADIDFRDKQVRMAPVMLTLDPVKALKDLGVETGGFEKWGRLIGRPIIRSNDAAFDFDEPAKSIGAFEIEVPEGIELTTEKGRKAVLKKVKGLVTLNRGEVAAEDLRAELFGGEVSLDLHTSMLEKNPQVDIAVEIRGVSVPEFNDWINPGNTIAESGAFDFNFDGHWRGSLASVGGRGRLSAGAENAATEGLLVVGGLISFVKSLVPTLSKRKAWSADLPFSIADGKATVIDGNLREPSVLVDFDCVLDLIEGSVDVRAGVDLRGVVGVVGSLISPFRSHLITVRGTGSVSDIKWRWSGRSDRK